MSASALILILAAYVLLLFGIGRFGELRASRAPDAQQPLVWSMALAVYCTSWTYYGAVGRAAENIWSYLPIYLGPALVFLVGTPILKRLILIAKQHRLTSLADFIATRHGRAPRLAIAVTIISVLAALPYIALQLKAIQATFAVLSPAGPTAGWDLALLTALGLGGFAILFGTRHINSSERNRGLTFAVAFESAFKLLVLLLITTIAVFVAPELSIAPALERLQRTPIDPATFWTHTLLAALAILCLPRQFHITVVENAGPDELRTARWLFPAYLLLVSLVVLPLTQLGQAVLPTGTNADTTVLQLPLWLDSQGLAVLVYLGGFSAATAMIVVSSIALSIMVSNEVVMPALLRRGRLDRKDDLGRILKLTRRLSIAGVLALAYVVFRALDQGDSLAAIGLIAFVGIAQLAPALLGAMYWGRANQAGAFWGMLAGTTAWIYTLLLPALLSGRDWVTHGPAEIIWLSPYGLFGLGDLDPVVHASLISLGANVAVYIAVSWLTQTPLQERLDAARFLQLQSRRARKASVNDLILVMERFYGPDRTTQLLEDFDRHSGQTLDRDAAEAPPELAGHVEHLLAGAMGSATAKALMDATLGPGNTAATELAQVLDQTSNLLQFNRELLQSALDNLSQAVSVVDHNHRLVAWNRRYQELFDLPDEALKVGEPIETILRLNAVRGLLGPGDPEEQVRRRLEHLAAQTRHRAERVLPDGRVLDVQGEPMPAGGFVSSFTDITELKRIQAELERSNQDLEARVEDRTAQMQRAQAEAEQANRSKTSFLAAASHDLMQPLNAARLFATTAAAQVPAAETRRLLQGIEASLQSMEDLLRSLLDMSKIDAGVLETQITAVSLADLLDSLGSEFELQMAQQGLRFRIHPSRLWVCSDAKLLRRLLQNFLSNAMRYTEQGRVVLGVRRCGDHVRIEVHDTGPGIAPDDQARIFEEFSRLGRAEQHGFGLGLAICQRISQLLEHPLVLRSKPGRGSCFGLRVPVTAAAPQAAVSSPGAAPRPRPLAGLRVLCVDNDPAVLEATDALLTQWGCVVSRATGAEQACQALADNELIIMDYHLDDGLLGSDLLGELRQVAARDIPAILVTADHSGAADEAAAALGCKLLRKPLKPAALRGLIAGLRLR